MVPLGSSTDKTMDIFLIEWDSEEEAYFVKVRIVLAKTKNWMPEFI